MIATDVDDSITKLKTKLAAETKKPNRAMDPYFYRSHLVHDRELEHIVFKSWIYALHESELPNSGDFQLLDIGEDSIIIARHTDGELHAMHNICRHRGAAVCEDPCGNRATFVCPYHGWVYNLDGSMRAAREMHVLSEFEPHEHGLKKIRLISYMGLVFINCDPEAADFLGPLSHLCLLYTSPSPRDVEESRMPSSA